MGKGNNISEFEQLLNSMAKGHVKVQTAWVIVKSVDWDSKTMVATGVLDDLDYNGVLLGLGNNYRKPVINSKCLIGLIENQDAAAFLIEAERCSESVSQVGDSILTVTDAGFLIERNGESLTKIMKDLLAALLAATFTNGAGTTSPANNSATFNQIKARIDTILK